MEAKNWFDLMPGLYQQINILKSQLQQEAYQDTLRLLNAADKINEDLNNALKADNIGVFRSKLKLIVHKYEGLTAKKHVFEGDMIITQIGKILVEINYIQQNIKI